MEVTDAVMITPRLFLRGLNNLKEVLLMRQKAEGVKRIVRAPIRLIQLAVKKSEELKTTGLIFTADPKWKIELSLYGQEEYVSFVCLDGTGHRIG